MRCFLLTAEQKKWKRNKQRASKTFYSHSVGLLAVIVDVIEGEALQLCNKNILHRLFFALFRLNSFSLLVSTEQNNAMCTAFFLVIFVNGDDLWIFAYSAGRRGENEVENKVPNFDCLSMTESEYEKTDTLTRKLTTGKVAWVKWKENKPLINRRLKKLQ